MIDSAKKLAANPNWPAPKRNSVFYSMSQGERIQRLADSEWPDLDFSNEWVMFSDEEPFDRQIDVDARSGVLQEAFGLDEMDTIEDVETETDAQNL